MRIEEKPHTVTLCASIIKDIVCKEEKKKKKKRKRKREKKRGKNICFVVAIFRALKISVLDDNRVNIE